MLESFVRRTWYVILQRCCWAWEANVSDILKMVRTNEKILFGSIVLPWIGYPSIYIQHSSSNNDVTMTMDDVTMTMLLACRGTSWSRLLQWLITVISNINVSLRCLQSDRNAMHTPMRFKVPSSILPLPRRTCNRPIASSSADQSISILIVCLSTNRCSQSLEWSALDAGSR